MAVNQITVIGGGLGGLAAAISLSRAGYQVTVLERAKEFVTVRFPSPFGAPFRGIRHDFVLGWGVNTSSPKRTLHQCLLQCATAIGAIIRLDSHVESIDFESGIVHLTGKVVIRADIIIGADGENSWCRSMLLGRPDPPSHFGHQIFSCHIPLSEVDHEHPELSSFRTDHGTSWWMGPGTMAIATTTWGEHLYINLMGGLIEPETTDIRGRPIEIPKEYVKASFED